MKLIVFDIDGTIIDSVKVDDDCFKSTFKKLHNIDLAETNWNDFKNVTDTGLTIEIFEKWLNRKPNSLEIENIKQEFFKQISHRTKEIAPIKGAIEFINLIASLNDLEVAFATGGWEETAKLKCNAVGLNLDKYLLKSSNDHFERDKIIELTIDEAMSKHKLNVFDSVVYFGDGLWDYRTTMQLGIDFIGVDFMKNGKLRKVGCNTIIKDYTDIQHILTLI